MATPHLDPIVRAAPAAEPGARPYDFARPRSFSDRQLRVAEDAHGALTAGLAAALGDALGEPVSARCTAVTEVLAVDVVRSRARPAALFTASLGAGGPALVIDLAPALALFLVERQLGGTDSLSAESRALSGLEQSVIERHWLPLLGVAFAEAWGAVPPRTERFTADPEALALGLPDAAVVVADVEVEVGNGSAALSLVYPAATVRALLDAYGARPTRGAPAAPDRVDGLLVDLRAELGRVRLPLGDLLRLAEGDVIPLDRAPDAPVPVWIGDRLRFEARAGTRGPNLALQLLTPPESTPAP